MKLSRSRAGFSLLASGLLTVALAGCGGGWGDLKPTIGSTSSSSNGASGTSLGNGASQSLTVTAGQPAIFSVTAQGTGPFQFQWLLNSQPIAGATSSTYTIPSTSANMNGAVYSVEIINAAGIVTAGPYTLTVNVPPAIMQQPVNQTVTAGQPATFTVTATGTAPMSYQWSENGTPITGATSSSLTTAATSVSGSGSTFTVAVSNIAGSVTSSTATLNVAPIVPALAFSPVGTENFGNPAFAVTASSVSNGAITYSVMSGPATIAGNIVTLTGTGSVVLQASQAASGNYAAAIATTSFSVGDEVPTLTFQPIPTETYGTAPFGVTARSVSSGAITYSVASGPAAIAGNMVTLTGTGSVVLQASQAASGNYAAASATTTFTVVAGQTPTITFPSPGTQAYSQTLVTVSAASNSPGTITYSVVSGPATIAGNLVTMTGAGLVTLQASQAASGGYSAGTAMTTFNITATNPQVTMQPVSQNICQNQGLSLSVAATNATSYQWNFNGVPIPGATSTTLAIGSASSSNTGNYTVTVSNPTASVTSQVATVNVGSTIVTNPANLTITQYQEGSFSVAATGSGHYTYQWWQTPYGSSPSQITGATSSLYVTPVQTTVTTSGQATGYYVQVTDTTCNQTLTSNQATLTVDAGNSPPTITTQPVGQTVAAGSGATFTAAAVGSPTVTYQWYVIPNAGTNAEIAGMTPATGTAISGATAATYTVPTSSTEDSNDQDVYYVVATNAYGSAVSQHATLAVDNGIQIQITDEPVDQYVNPGQSATFSVTASSTATLTYQWYEVPPGGSAAQQTVYTLQSGTPTATTVPASAVAISGAMGPSYTASNVSASQTGTVYYVVVSNGSTAQVYSSTASLTVGQPAGITACSTDWQMLGNTIAQSCGYELVTGADDEQGEIVWPTLMSTGNLQLSFTITTSNTTNPPADGFSMVLGDPSLGATLQSVGLPGEGIGAKGLPGFVVAFDDFYNTACTTGCYPTGTTYPADPSTSGNPDYLGVGRGEPSEWENPYFNTNLNLPVLSGDSYSLAEYGKTITHSYVVSIVNSYMSVTMDGTQVFSGNVTVPPVAYLYLTASTGGSAEEVQITNISAAVNAPSN